MKKNSKYITICSLSICIAVGLFSGAGYYFKTNAKNEYNYILPCGESNIRINYVSCIDSSITPISYDVSKKYDYSSLSFSTKNGSFTANVSTSVNSLAVSDDLNNPLPNRTFKKTITGTTDPIDTIMLLKFNEEKKEIYFMYFSSEFSSVYNLQNQFTYNFKDWIEPLNGGYNV